MAVDSFSSPPQIFPDIPSTTLEDLPKNTQMAIARALEDQENLPSHRLEPGRIAELQEIIGHCQKNHWRILPCGNQSKLDWGGLGKPVDLVVSSAGLNRIVDHAVADLTVTVEAGVKLKDLQAILQPHQQFLPLDPLYQDQATVGGIMAIGCAGPWQQRYGGVRDLILGFSFVRWDGQLAKAGGRVVKNVAGYDLMKLFIGSYGTLGFISQITFRLYPLPTHGQTLFLTGDPQNLSEVTQILRRSGLTPTGALLLSAPLSQNLALGNEMGLLLRFENLVPVVQAQIGQVAKLAQALSLQTKLFGEDGETNLWQKLNQTMENRNEENGLLCKFGLLPAKAVDYLQQLPGQGFIQMGTGLGHGRFNNLNWEGLTAQRNFCENHCGYLTLLEASPTYKKAGDVWGYNGQGLEMMSKIKNQFDPQNLFSPGRFVGGL